MPFLSEELWQVLGKRDVDQALVVSSWPKTQKINDSILSQFEHTTQIVSAIRSIRKQKNIPYKSPLELIELSRQLPFYESVVQKLANISSCQQSSVPPKQALSFRVGVSEYFIPFALENVEEEIEKLNSELVYQKGFLQGVQKKLSNERFVQNAPEAVIAVERKKEADALAKIKLIEQNLAQLQS